jgi:hypothetical protein
MAKIRVEQMYVGKKPFAFEIKYTTKWKRFEVDLPEFLETFAVQSETERPHGKTEEELLSKIHTFIKKFENDTVSERKLIWYMLDWGSKRVESFVSTGYDDTRRCTDGEARIEFNFKVVVEKMIGGTPSYIESDTDEDGDVHTYNVTQEIKRQGQFIEWTQEAETFMADLYASMETLMRKLESFIGSKELLIKAVGNKIKLLPKE